MGQIPNHLLEEWLRVQESDHKQTERRTVVKLPCCGAGVEVTATQAGQDQYITCPNKDCGKRSLLTWGMRPQMRTEVPLDPL